MNPLWRKSLSCLLAASLLAGSVPPSAYADPPATVAADARPEPPRVDGSAAMAFFLQHRVLTGDGDALKPYLQRRDGTLTPIGEALYRSLRSRYNVAEGVEALTPALTRLREAGPYDQTKQEFAERTFALFRQRFTDLQLRDDGSVEGSYQWGALVEAYMAGLAAPQSRGQAGLTQIAMPDGTGFEFWDERGLLYRINNERVLTYNRELQRQQRQMNQDRPRQAPFVPETGRYNVEMMQYQYWRLKNQYDDIQKAYVVDRLVLLAQLLGRQVREERYYLETAAVQAELEREAQGKTRTHRGRVWSLTEIVEQRMRARRFYLNGANDAVVRFKADMELIAQGNTITDAQVQSLGLDERNALRWLSLSVLSTQEYAVRNQMESLDPNSADSQMLQQALGASPFNADLRNRYADAGAALRRRLEALQGLLTNTRTQLVRSDYAGSLDLVQAALASAQRELTEIGTDYSLYVDVPSGAFTAAAESGQSWRNQLGTSSIEGWSVGRWGISATGAVADFFGLEHGRHYRNVRGQLPAYSAMAEMIARGDMAGARRAAIAMNPHAGERFQEVRLSGGDTRITDALRIAGSLRANRMEIAAVQPVNKWASAAASFITWTVTIALMAPVVTGGLGIFARTFEGIANVAAKIPLVGEYVAILPRLASEGALHLQARLVTLSPAASEIPAAMQSNFVSRYIASSAIRGVNAAGRQISFTGISGLISGGFTTVQHAFDGSASQFTSTGDAFWQGFTGGVVWANDSFHPALGYVGVPSSAFRNTALAPVTESLANRGLVGNVVAAADAGVSWAAGRTSMLPRWFNLEAFARGEWAIRAFGREGISGVLGRTVQLGAKGTGFVLAMTDQVAKYAVFSHGVGALARWRTYSTGQDAAALPPSALEQGGGPDAEQARLDREAMEVERRIKSANAAGAAWEASPIWLIIPTFPAHVALEGAMAGRAAEGMRQYDAAGRTHEYANAPEGKELPLLEGRPKTPLSQRIFDWSWKTQESADIWVVTKEARSEGIRKALIQEVGAVEGNLAGVNPMRFYEIWKMPDHARLKNKLAVNDEVRDLAQRNLADALVANPELAVKILSSARTVEIPGFGRVDYKIREEVAATLHAARNQWDIHVPARLMERAEPLIRDSVQSDRLPKQPARDFMEALRRAGRDAPGLDKFADFMMRSSSDWRAGRYPERTLSRELPITEAELAKAVKDYNGLIGVWRQELTARVNRGEMTAREANVATKLFDAMNAIEARFNSFNNPTYVRARTGTIIDSIKSEFGARGSSGARTLVSRIETAFREWTPSGGRVSQDRGFDAAMSKVNQALTDAVASKTLSAHEVRVLKEAVGDLQNSPWAVRDKGGNPLPGWRPEQFESLMTALGMVMKQGHLKTGMMGRSDASIRLFQMLKTGGGKTMLTFEGLLPFAEADAAMHGQEVAFLTVQSNLEAQARADYFAYRKFDSKLTFDTYEGLKTKIAEGKTRGRNALHKYWILGDEMDGAALQPALTIGEVTGRITRRSSLYHRLDELQNSLLNRMENALAGRANRVMNAARDAMAEAGRLADHAEYAKIQEAVARLDRNAEALQTADGPQARLRAETGLREAARELRSLTEGNVSSGMATSIAEMRGALDGMERVLSEPPPRAADPEVIRRAMNDAFRLQRNLMERGGSAEGLQRLMVEARNQRMAGEARAARLEGDIRAAEGRGNATEAAALRAELEIVQAETRQAARFEGVDAGARAVRLSERLVTLENAASRDGASPAEAARLREVREQIEFLERRLSPEQRQVHEQLRETLRGQRDTLARLEGVEGGGRNARLSEELVRLEAQEGRGAITAKGAERLGRLREEVGRFEKELSPELRQAAEEHRALLRSERELTSRFEDPKAGARIRPLSERLVELEASTARGESSAAKADAARVRQLGEDIKRIEEGMPPERRQAHEEHRALLRAERKLGEEMGVLDGQIVEARRNGRPTESLQNQLRLKDAERATLRARALEKGAELGSGAADGGFGPGLQRLRMLESKVSQLEARVERAKARNEKLDASVTSELASLRAQKAELEALSIQRARTIFSESADEIAALAAKKGARAPGFEGRARRLIEARGKLIESFTADENPMYSVYRQMKEDAEPIANNKQLLNEKREVWEPAADLLLRRVDGANFFAALPSIVKMTYQVFSGKPITVPVDRVGLARIHAAKLLRALFMDPIMPPGQRQRLFWTIAPGILSTKGLFGQSSWVRAEFLKLVQAFHENPAGIRLDGITKRINVVHNGQWFESMDNESRRFWELEYGVDLTLPYTNRSISTIRDLTTDKRANFISFSGTAGDKFRGHLEANTVPLAGKGSEAPIEGVRMDMRMSQSEKIAAIRESILRSSLLSQDHMVVNLKDQMSPTVRAEIENYLANCAGCKDKDINIVRRLDTMSPETQAYLRDLRSRQPESTNLVVLSVSDTHVLKQVRRYLIESGLVKENEIAMVFSDSEFLRLNRPDARVHEQMNLAGLNDGTVRVLILDTRVGGRGLDLNYKGNMKDATATRRFKGYTNYDMLIVDPHEMSAVHLLQAQGRIDLGRVLPGAFREFSLVMDVRAVQGEAMFRQMFRESDVFAEILKEPGLREFARQRGLTTVDWAALHEYVLLRESTGPEGEAMANKYRAEVQEWLAKRQLEVEEDQLRSSSVSQDPSSSPGRFPGLLRFTPGRRN